jgi:hypothetical protein
VKRIFLENLATKAMALFLAALTWVYLFTQGNGREEIDVEFQPPPFDREAFASVVYRDSDGRLLKPGGPLRILITGPRGEVQTCKRSGPLTFTCKFSVDGKLLDRPQGSVQINVEQSYFGLPGTIHVQPLPSAQIKLEYVKYVDKEIELLLPSDPWEGEPREEFKVESVSILPSRIKAKVPADQPAVEKVAVRRVSVSGRFENFTERGVLEPGARVVAVTPFRVEVKIVPVPATRRLQLDLHLMAKEENKARVALQTKTVTAELQGPKQLIQGAPEADFLAYVVVTDADVATPGPKNINAPQLGCHLRDPKYAGKVVVVLMPDVAPENRQVKITVLPK